MNNKKNIKNFIWIILSILFLILIGWGLSSIYKEYNDNKEEIPEKNNEQVNNNNEQVDNNNALASELANLIAKKYNKNPNDVKVIIDEKSDNFAKGVVKFLPENQPGNSGIILATQVNEQWQIIFDGNGFPQCFETDKYGIPSYIISGCINENGEFRKNNWELIKNAITNCQVEEVMQTHSQYVTAELKDGNRLEGVEPKIDDIIDLAIASQEKCGEIMMATE